MIPAPRSRFPVPGVLVTQATTIILGGGIAGLWLCDALRLRGDAVVLVESTALGTGQTISSQGIIHGGVKYALAGALTESATNIGEMPGRWRAALAGSGEPDLRDAVLRADYCHLWQTEGLSSGLGMLGARLALEVTPRLLPPTDRPEILRRCPGAVARLDEPVVDVASVLRVLANRNAGHLLLVEEVQLRRGAEGRVLGVQVSAAGKSLDLDAGTVVLLAGSGNAALRSAAGLDPKAMQRRPLHMVMVRGSLPVLNGHCVDGAATRATITTVHDSHGRAVWLVGGLVAEQGVGMTPEVLRAHARQELEAILPGVSLADVEWGTWRVDRAERAVPGGARPDDVQIIGEHNVLSAWPTKLALAPRLADRLMEMIPPTRGPMPVVPDDWPRPAVAVPPWDAEAAWHHEP